MNVTISKQAEIAELYDVAIGALFVSALSDILYTKIDNTTAYNLSTEKVVTGMRPTTPCRVVQSIEVTV